MDVIAERKLIVHYSDGSTGPVWLRIARPVDRGNGDWTCEVEGTGLRLWEGPTSFWGVGSWHALMLAQGFLRRMLSYETERGATFHWEDSEHVMSVEELFVLGEIKDEP